MYTSRWRSCRSVSRVTYVVGDRRAPAFVLGVVVSQWILSVPVLDSRRTNGRRYIRVNFNLPFIFLSFVSRNIQAVVNSRNKSLALLWRFYDQAPTVTHQLAGRVMHFDFSVEYDVRLSANFLEYLKQEEMPIMVCEWEKQDKPFASCLLPLRDALLHTNRRVDMSLALIGGAGMGRRDASGGGGAGEEAGVLDVWCMLRAPPHSAPAQTLASFHRQPSSLERILDADHTDFHLARDLDMHRASKPQHAEIKKASYDSENIYDIMNSKKWRRASALKQTETSRKKSVTILPKAPRRTTLEDTAKLSDDKSQTLEITILWLALNEECQAMSDPKVKRLYVAYSFLGKRGAELETPCSFPKPKNFMDKCHFNFTKSFVINECDVGVLSAMSRRRATGAEGAEGVQGAGSQHCIVFSVVSEPPEDPLGLDACEDIGWVCRVCQVL
ncbi:uncharacterized protein LOC119829402 [Zerene cesonia]|uniref:uncharacterized protein LOC119829402 n=1 Tax=Zerene cesonia TaxID=33412 RepID=UPI0018E58D4C|nr:uncharacterized protein LOC119829402 [Zerene cesonia]